MSFFRLWLPYFLLFAVLMSLWSIATPLDGAPDEPAHVERAVSLDRGELLGRSVPGPNNGARTRISIPATYLPLDRSAVDGVPCYAFKPTVTATCLPRIKQSAKLVSTTDYTGRYPPLYYAIVGIPTIFTARLFGEHLMGIFSALLSSAFGALAMATARRWSASRLLPAGILIAFTPMALFLAGTINPNGLEISSSIALWTAATVLVTNHVTDPPAGLLAVIGVSASVLALCRADSPLWLVVIPLILSPMWYRRFRWQWLGSRKTLTLLGVTGCAVAVAVGWTLVAHAFRVIPSDAPHAPTVAGTIHFTIANFPSMVEEQIGIFGWLDIPAPWLTMTIWYLLVGGVILLTLSLGRRRQVLTMILAILSIIILPVVIGIVGSHQSANVAQGRYYLPIAAGIPILALGSLGTNVGNLRTSRVLTGISVAVALGQFCAFFYALHRYRVGIDQPAFGNGSLVPSQVWSPPLGTPAVEVLFLLACVAIIFTLRGLPHVAGFKPQARRGRFDNPEADGGRFSPLPADETISLR